MAGRCGGPLPSQVRRTRYATGARAARNLSPTQVSDAPPLGTLARAHPAQSRHWHCLLMWSAVLADGKCWRQVVARQQRGSPSGLPRGYTAGRLRKQESAVAVMSRVVAWLDTHHTETHNDTWHAATGGGLREGQQGHSRLFQGCLLCLPTSACPRMRRCLITCRPDAQVHDVERLLHHAPHRATSTPTSTTGAGRGPQDSDCRGSSQDGRL